MKRILFSFLALAALLSPVPAAAQTACKYIAYGVVLTPAQWNYCFSAKADTFGYVPVNKAGDTMLGKLTTISPSVAAGFNLSPGLAPSSPVNGDIWSTLSGVYAYVNGSTVQFTTTAAGIVSGANGGTGVANTGKTITIGASLTTTGAGAPTLAFPASPFTYTFQGSSDTIVGRATTDTLTNKTLTSPVFGGTVTGDNTVPLTILAQSGANTMLGNWGSDTANVAAKSMPACADTGGNHLNYISGTGITCGSTSVTGSFVQNYLTGLTLSTAGSSTTFTTAAGMASDVTNAQQMVLASSLAKTTASWVVGAAAGCLDTGAIAINTWYHVFEIERTDLTVVDVLCSLSATTPTMPANYTFKRRIGAMKTNGSSQWSSFTQVGGFVNYGAESTDNLNTNCVAANTAYTLTVPTGVVVAPIFTLRVDYTGAVTNFLVGSGGTQAALTIAIGSAGTSTYPISNSIVTNTSAQIAINAASTLCQFTTFVLGYYDFRGQ